MRRYLPALLVVVILALLAAWWFSPKQVVKRRVLALLDTIEVPATMSDLARNTRGPNLATYLAERVTFNPPETLGGEIGSIYERDQIAARYSAVARYARSVSIEDVNILDIVIVDSTADVTLTLDAIVEAGDRRPADGIQHIDMVWTKTDEGWLLEEVSWIETGR